MDNVMTEHRFLNEERRHNESGHSHICSVLEILEAKWALLVIGELHKGLLKYARAFLYLPNIP